jgi:hypothetical protein
MTASTSPVPASDSGALAMTVSSVLDEIAFTSTRGGR